MAIQTIATLKANMPQGTAGGTTVADIHDVVDTFEDRTTQAVLTKTANYTATAADNRRRIIFSSATALTFTIPNNLPVGWECSILQFDVGSVQVVPATGATLVSRDNQAFTAGENAQAYLWICQNTSGTGAMVALSGDTA